MTEKEKVLGFLDRHGIKYELYNHPALPTIELAQEHWKNIDAQHCKNLFFRNHKGNRHYLVILDFMQPLAIHDLEKRLKQGKISFASEKRMDKYLGIKAGSVSVFGLINDLGNHIHLFLDQNLKSSEKISFHPNDNTSTVVISFRDFERFLEISGNTFEWMELY